MFTECLPFTEKVGRSATWNTIIMVAALPLEIFGGDVLFMRQASNGTICDIKS